MRIQILPLSSVWKRRIETILLASYSLHLVLAAFVLATEHLYWMALGQLIVMWMLLDYAHEVRKSRIKLGNGKGP